LKLFSKTEWKLLWPFYLDALLSPMLFFAPAFFVVYFADLGFSLFQVGLIIAASQLFALLFEIPTGAVADIYGRKFSVLFGIGLGFFTFIALFFFTNFYVLLAIFAVMGLSGTFMTGADEAWITDLVKHKRKELLDDFFIKSQSIANVGFVISGLVGALMVKYFGISVIWLAASASMLLSLWILSYGEEHFKQKHVKMKDSMKEVSSQSVKALNYSRKEKIILYLIIATAIMALAGGFGNLIAWVPFLQDMGFPDHAFGYIWSGLALVGVVAPLLSKRLYKGEGKRLFLMHMTIIISILAILVIFVQQLIWAIAVMLAIVFFEGMKSPASLVLFHKHVKDSLRASVGSVKAMIISLVGIGAVPLGGYAVDVLGAQFTIFLSGVISLPAVLVYYMMKEDKKEK